ncbi:MAG: hypothetical protein F2817_11170, partial [Actinobacteria bacterium]|nr:hypothetical protein [Actinomycetota bacterium]
MADRRDPRFGHRAARPRRSLADGPRELDPVAGRGARRARRARGGARRGQRGRAVTRRSRGAAVRRADAAGLLLGLLADRAFGDPRRGHPVALFGSAMLALEARIWRDDRAAGAGYALAGAALGAGPVLVLHRTTRDRPLPRAVLTAAVTWGALGGRSLAGAGRDLGALVARGDLEGARALAPTLVGRDPATLDGAGLARAG